MLMWLATAWLGCLGGTLVLMDHGPVIDEDDQDEDPI